MTNQFPSSFEPLRVGTGLALMSLVISAGVLVSACGGSASDGSGAFPSNAGDPGGDGNGGAGGVDGGDGTDGFVPEDEQELDLQAPQGGDRFVFVVSTTLDAVVRIDGVTLAVDLIEVGGEPTVMRSLGGEDALLVYNRGTVDFSLVRFGPTGEPTVTTIDAGARINRLEVSPSGRFAVAFFDARRASPWETLGDLQLALVLDLTAGAETLTPVGVGFGPEEVVFTADETELLVVTEAGVSVIDLAGLGQPQFAPEVELGAVDPSAPDREVLLTPSGSHAVMRVGGEIDVRVVPLDGTSPSTVTLSASPTDIDIMPDGTSVLAVVRDQMELARWSLADPNAVEITDLPDTPAGTATVNAAAGEVLLHTTLPGEEWLAVLSLETGAVDRHDLKKGVVAVAPSPDGSRVVILHDRLDEPPSADDDLEARIDKSFGYSVLDTESGYVKLVMLASEPTAFLVTPDSERAFVLIPDTTGENYHATDAVDLTSMQVHTHALGSPPEHLIEIPAAGRVAVSQDHPVGRITFVDTASGKTETVTGFELNGLIR